MGKPRYVNMVRCAIGRDTIVRGSRGGFEENMKLFDAFHAILLLRAHSSATERRL